MLGRRRGWVLIALLPLLLLSSLSPGVFAQSESFYGVQIEPEKSSIVVDYLGSETIDVTLRDVSFADQSRIPTPNQITIDTEIRGNNTTGWTASASPPGFTTQPGDVHTTFVTISAGATIENPRIEVVLQVTYNPRGGEAKTTNTSFLVTANPNPVVRMAMEGAPPELRPDGVSRVPITVTNHDYYPQMIGFRTSAPEGWMVSPPSSVRLEPGETRTIFLEIRAPQDPWFILYPESPVIQATADTQTYAGGTYTLTVPVSMAGSYLPGWVYGHLFLLVLGAGIVVHRSARAYKEYKLEKGKPSYPGIAPEKEARLEALAVLDPERAEQRQEGLKKDYKERKAGWKSSYKDRKRETREQRREAMQEHDHVLDERDREAKKQENRQETAKGRRQKLRERKRELEQQREQEDARTQRLQELRERKRALREDEDPSQERA